MKLWKLLDSTEKNETPIDIPKEAKNEGIFVIINVVNIQ